MKLSRPSPDHLSRLSILCFWAHFRDFSMFGAFGVQMDANMQNPYCLEMQKRAVIALFCPKRPYFESNESSE